MIAISMLLAALASGPIDDKQPSALFRPEMFETLINSDHLANASPLQFAHRRHPSVTHERCAS